MLVDLNPLPYRHAMELIKWCFEHNIDRERCLEVMEALAGKKDFDEVNWILDVPDKHITFFIMKWV